MTVPPRCAPSIATIAAATMATILQATFDAEDLRILQALATQLLQPAAR